MDRGPLVDAVPAVRGIVGRPRRRPRRVIADRGYDHDKCRCPLWQRGIKPVIVRRHTDRGSGLGHYRWLAERTFAWLHHFKRLLTCLLQEAAALILIQVLRPLGAAARRLSS
jgi:transposase